MFGNKKFPSELLKYKDDFAYIEPGYKIDYSSWDVINLLELFNEKIYEELMNYSKFIKNSKLKKAYYYFKYDRTALVEKADLKLMKIPIIYPLLKLIYKILKRIKNIIFCDHYKLLKKENEDLKTEIEMIKQKLRELDNKKHHK